MKNKVLKSIIGVSLVAFTAMTLTKNTKSQVSDTFLSNIIALSTANAEETVTCEQPPMYPTKCHTFKDANGNILSISYGKKVSS